MGTVQFTTYPDVDVTIATITIATTAIAIVKPIILISSTAMELTFCYAYGRVSGRISQIHDN